MNNFLLNPDILFKTGTQKFRASSDKDNETWTLTATGDLAPIGNALTLIDQNKTGELCGDIKQLVEADISIANLESGLYFQKPNITKAVTAHFDSFMKLHRQLPFTIYNMANNHIKDAGSEELIKVLSALGKSNIKVTGAGINSRYANKPLFLNIGGTKIGILAYAQDEGQVATEYEPGTALLSKQNILNNIPTLVANCDVSIVILHEGFEFMPVPRIPFRKLCHNIAEMGVKLIISHHPHVPQGIEQHGNTLIFYSLGNFIFDLEYHRKYKWTSKSFIPKITFSGSSISELTIQPITMHHLHPFSVTPASGKNREDILSHLKQLSADILSEDCTHKYTEDFFSTILMPEFFNFIRREGNNNDGNYSEIIKAIKSSEPVHKLFYDFLCLYANDTSKPNPIN
jgi:poly-gamma-glutamate capsule biosynthesis protein CapA/YwtB (metallophosphatase superfamily)